MVGEPRSHSVIVQKETVRELYDRVLIVCEGTKSEPNYFDDMVDRSRLSTANIVIDGFGFDPRRLVATAKRLEKEDRQLGDSYDVVYCVFDRDQHAHFWTASRAAQSANFKLARSWPCFEYWLVLHYRYHRRSYAPSGNRSASQNCEIHLKRLLSGYKKGMAGLYRYLEGRLETAKSNAKRALSHAETTGVHDPSTEVHLLVAYLQDLKP